jgi:glycopeptide antibiotics resistance protein
VRRSRKQLFGHALWILSVVVVVAVTITPLAESPVAQGSNTTERLCLVCGELGVVDAVWNVILFVPFGLGLAIAGVRASRALLAMFAATLMIEFLQVTTVAGRDASLGDIIWNSLGGAMGWALGTRMASFLYPAPRRSFALTTCSLVVWMGACLTAPWAFQRDPSESEYVGQLGRALGGFLPYPGHVIAASVGDLTIPDDLIRHSVDIRRALLDKDGTSIEARVVPAKPPNWNASIVRIVDHRHEEILELSAFDTDLFFAFRTHASRLQLRPLYFRLPGAFPENGRDPRGDTVTIAARYATDRVELRATGRAATVQSRIPLTSSAGWRLIAPMRTETDGSLRDTLLNASWLLVLLTPVTYWLSFVSSFIRRRTMLAVVTATLLAGLAAGPYAFQIALPSLADFGGVLAGLTVGTLLAAFVRRRIAPAATESS